MAQSSSPIAPEVEAKLIIPHASGVRAIARLKRLGGHPLRPRGLAHLHSLYLDTPELILARHGVALRLRQDRDRWEATAKWAGRSEGAVHERPELNVALPGKPTLPFVLPPGPLHVQLAALVAARPLRPILITEIQRRLFDVLPAAGETAAGVTAELALDRVRLVAPDGEQAAERSATYFELELEQRQGKREDIVALAQRLQDDFGLPPSKESKFARGLSLLYGNQALSRHEPQPPGPAETVESAARKVVARHLARLRQHDPATRLGADPEALHDMRVAVRRLRAAARVFEEGMPVRFHAALERDLRWLGQSLGAVRDLDVHLGKFDRYRRAQPPKQRADLNGLLEHLQAERLDRRREMLAVLDSRRYFRLLVRLERFAQAPPRRRSRPASAEERLAVAGRRALERASGKVLKLGRRLNASNEIPAAKDLHRLRIHAKRLRYLLEFLRQLTGKPGRRFVKRLVRLQDLLGAHQDAVVATEYVRRYVQAADLSSAPQQSRPIDALLSHEAYLAEQARAAFHRSWQRFAQKRTPADLRAILQRLRKLREKREAKEKSR